MQSDDVEQQLERGESRRQFLVGPVNDLALEQFQWDHPKKINRLQVQNLFRLEFIPQKANVVLLGTVGIGKTHLASALGYAACLEDYSVLFAGAIEVINDLQDAQKTGRLNRALKKYLRPQFLILD